MSNRLYPHLILASCTLACHSLFIGERPTNESSTSTSSSTSTTGEPASTASSEGAEFPTESGATSGSSTSGEGSSSTLVPEPADTTATGSTGHAPPPDCGNKVIEHPEECDEGTNVDTATCNFDCTAVSCGDGHINPKANETCLKEEPACRDDDCTKCGDGKINGPAGEEECDSDPICDESCKLKCGNGALDPSEECDKGPLNGMGNGFCSAKCTRNGLLAFVTAGKFYGNFGFPTGIDGICDAHANEEDALTKDRQFAPWISYEYYDQWYNKSVSYSPNQWITCGVPQKKGRPIYLVDEKTLVAETFPPSGSLANAINMDQFGLSLDPRDTPFAWTNTKLDGSIYHTDTDCDSWYLSIGSGAYGDITKKGSQWTHAGDTKDCATEARIYCFEQPENPCID